MNYRGRIWITINSLLIVLFFLLVRPAYGADATVSGTVTRASNGTTIYLMLLYVENDATGALDYAYTDATGNYTITIDDAGSGTAGDYTIYNTTYSYSTSEEGVIFIKQIQHTTLADGENKVGVNFSLNAQGRIAGNVYESDSTTPIANAYSFAATTTAGLNASGGDYTTTAGYYILSIYNYTDTEQSAAGTFTLYATAAGYFGVRYENITVSDNTTTTKNMTLTKGSTINGKITNTAGVPIPEATITITELTSNGTYSGSTDSNGDYSIIVYDLTDYGGTAVGSYRLAVTNAAGYVNQSKLFEITTDESTSSGNNFSLEQAGAITGTIYESNGSTAVALATISANDGYGNTYSATAGSDGTYTLNNLRASTNYTITVSKTNYVTQKAYHITVVSGQTTQNQNFNLTDASSFLGTVVAKESNTPLEGATIKLYTRGKPRGSAYYYDYTTTTVTNGTFSFTNIAPGRYRVEINKDGYLTKKFNANLQNDISGKIYKLTAAITIFGRVTTNQQPVANALVSIFSKQDSSIGYNYAYTDNLGYYNFNNLKPNKYTFRVSSTDYVDKIITKNINDNSTININVGSGGSIAGFIYDADTHLPLSSYVVRVRGQAVIAYSDSNGYYILDGLAPGKYKLYVASTAYEISTVNNVKVKSNKTKKNVNFNLTPKQ